jgi:SulP family sulfate permease
MCPAVNRIDASGLESLEAINEHLRDAGVTLHLSEVKGPVMDRLKRSDFLEELSGKVYLNTYDAMEDLDLESVKHAFSRDAKTTDPAAIPCPSLALAGFERA